MTQDSRKNYLKGAAILSIAGIFVKILGAIFKIPLYYIIKSDGMGYYSTAYPIYVLILSFSTAGIPIAVSKMISNRFIEGKDQEANVFFQKVLFLLFIVGLVSSLSLFVFAEQIMILAGNKDASYTLKALAPALFVVPIMSAYRGYFQGQQKMLPTAISQSIEQGLRVIFGLVIAYVLVRKGPQYGAQGAAVGTSLGCFMGLAVIWLFYIKGRDKSIVSLKIPYKTVLIEFAQIALPIIAGSLVLPVMNAVDATTVIGRLIDAGYSQAKANRLLGYLQGMAGTLINFPQIIITAISASIVPAISSAYATHDIYAAKKQAVSGLKFVFIIALPASAGLFVLSNPIMRLLFPQEPSHLSSILSIISFQLVFLGVIQVTTAILQGAGKVFIPVKHLIIAVIIKIFLTYILVGIPSINIRGAAIATVISYIIFSFLNYRSFCKIIDIHGLTINLVFKPFLATCSMSLFTWMSYHGILFLLTGRLQSYNPLALIISILIGICSYGIFLFVFGAISIQELKTIPLMSKLLDDKKWIKKKLKDK